MTAMAESRHQVRKHSHPGRSGGQALPHSKGRQLEPAALEEGRTLALATGNPGETSVSAEAEGGFGYIANVGFDWRFSERCDCSLSPWPF